METVKKVLVILLKDFSSNYTITSLSDILKISRVGTWKIVKKLELEKLIILRKMGLGKTNTYTIKLNWQNPIIIKTLELYLTQEALEKRRWIEEFKDLEKETEFTILYGSILHSLKEANDIDVLTLAKKNNLNKINNALHKRQKFLDAKIHAINLTKEELKEEIKINKAMRDAFKKGIILYGQEKFIQFIKGTQEK